MKDYQKRSTKEIQAELDKYNHKIEDIVKSWEKNPEEITNYLEFASKFYAYSPKNQALIFEQNSHTTFLGSFNSFKEMGWQVKKGEKGLKIFTPVKASYFYREGEKQAAQLFNATNDEKNLIKQGAIDLKTVLRFKLGTVFDISQTNCPKEEYPTIFKYGENSKLHAELYEDTKDYVSQQGFPVFEKDVSSISLRGSFSPSTNVITISDKLNDTQKLSTLLHEFSHALLNHQSNAHPLGKYRDEFQADGLTILFYSRLGLEVTDALKDHIAQHVKNWFKDIESMSDEIKKEYSLENSFKIINEAFKTHVEDLEMHLENCFDRESDQNFDEAEDEHCI